MDLTRFCVLKKVKIRPCANVDAFFPNASPLCSTFLRYTNITHDGTKSFNILSIHIEGKTIIECLMH